MTVVTRSISLATAGNADVRLRRLFDEIIFDSRPRQRELVLQQLGD